MRVELKKKCDIRGKFHGIFSRFGKKNAYKGPDLITLLLKDIYETSTNDYMCDHLWFNYTKGFQKLGELKEGDKIEFDARIKNYEKGYRGRREEWELEFFSSPETDYKLSHPTKIVIKERRLQESTNFTPVT